MPIPYARAVEIHDNDVVHYGVECPICHETFSGSGKTEDTITKSASRRYATHYVKRHTTGEES